MRLTIATGEDSVVCMRVKYIKFEEPMTKLSAQLILQSISMYVLFLRQAYVVEGLHRKLEGLARHTNFNTSSVGPTRAPSALPNTREAFAQTVQLWATRAFEGAEVEVTCDDEDYPEHLKPEEDLN